MNANRQRFWMIADGADWVIPDDVPALEYDAATRRLRLRCLSEAVLPGVLDTAALNALLTQPSMAVDAFGSIAFWDPAAQSVAATTASASPVSLCGPLAGAVVCDLALGFDDVLYVSLRETGGAQRSFLRFIDRRGRWTAAPDAPPGTAGIDLPLTTMRADRLACDPSGGVWIMDRTNGKIGRVKGYPLADFLPVDFAPTVFRPVEENTDPPRVIEDRSPSLTGETLTAIACGADGRLALLSWTGNGDALLRIREADGTWRPSDVLTGTGAPASLIWLSAQQLAVIPGPRTPRPNREEAIVYDIEFSQREQRCTPIPAGGYYPLVNIGQQLFVAGTVLPPRYPTANGGMSPLLAMSTAAFCQSGEASTRVLDSGEDATIWHRLYVEAIVPPGCTVTVSLGATDEPEPAPADLQWYDHYFGAVDTVQMTPGAARGVWLSQPSEIPHHAGLLGCSPASQRCGLFAALIQRPGCRVRALAGRYLLLRVTLQGSGDATPEVAAIRAYAPRFSYRDQYLPELYRENLFGDDADGAGDATPADFLGRFLDLFEGILTPLEDRVAAAHILTDPRSTPSEALEWLGSWIGATFDPGFPPERRRAWIQAAHRLFRARGTLAGLQLALEIATGGSLTRQFVDGREVEFPQGGSVTGGRIIVIEDFRLRRTFATILGADLSDENNPLLPGGLLSSANSFVGDTLILGEESKKEFLALFDYAFSQNAGQKTNEENAVFDLYDKLAYRVTVLVHNEITPTDMGLLQRIVAQETPAHVDARVVSATWPFLVGLASLIDVDTYLTPRPPRAAAQTDGCRLGENAFVQRAPTLDPRLTN